MRLLKLVIQMLSALIEEPGRKSGFSTIPVDSQGCGSNSTREKAMLVSTYRRLCWLAGLSAQSAVHNAKGVQYRVSDGFSLFEPIDIQRHAACFE